MTTVGTGAATAPSSRALGAAGAAGEPSAASVELVSVVRRFAGEGAPRGGPPARPAVDGVSLAVAPGELFVLLGPSGCGKSTTLRLVAGLEDADAGEVRIGGRSVTHVPPEARDVAMVFQGFALYPRMTVRENLAFPLRMRGASRVDRNAAVDAAARLLRLEPLLDRTPEALSGGERQRVAMGRAIVRRPSVFLFDEPLSNLDAALRTELRVEVGALVRRLGTTSLYVTHDQVEAMTLADRIAVLRAGKVEQVGTPEEVYARPATSFVASFLGSPPMSLVPGRVVGDDVVAGPLRIARGRAEPISEAVEIGLRAEDVTAVPATDGAFVVAFREPYGAETVLGLEAAAPDGGATARLVAKAPGFAALARGARVNVTFDPARAHLFDPARGGARLAR